MNIPLLIKTGQVDLAKIRPATIRAVNEMVEERLKRAAFGRRAFRRNALGTAWAR